MRGHVKNKDVNKDYNDSQDDDDDDDKHTIYLI